jgi:hypothetical protein
MANRRSRTGRTRGGGSAGQRGYSFQALAIAGVEAHLLAERALGWLDTQTPDIPMAVESETDGPGDDIRVLFADDVKAEAQVRSGRLRADRRFREAVDKLVEGLRSDPGLFGLLIVDRWCPQSISREFAEDVIRIGQGRNDGLRDISRKLKRRSGLGAAALRDICRRLRIIQLDTPQVPGVPQFAEVALRRIAGDDAHLRRLWHELTADATRIVELRGRSDAGTLMRSLSRAGLSLALADSSMVVLRSAYTAWVERRTSRFSIPGIGAQLSIQEHWLRLGIAEAAAGSAAEPRTVREEIRIYHDPTVLVGRSASASQIDPDHILAFTRRVIVVGGAGCGKSTLLRRIANERARAGDLVALVRLPVVARRMEQLGESFHEALVATSSDDFGGPAASVADLLRSPSIVLADALDECGSARGAVVDALAAWAYAHPNCKVLITTRPVGYESAWFAGWTQLVIMPFADDGLVEAFATLLRPSLPEGTSIETAATSLATAVRAYRASSLAQRSPLLLGLLVAVRIHGGMATTSIGELCNVVITNLLEHDTGRRSDPHVRAVAWRSIELLGWYLRSGANGLDLHQLLAQSLSAECSIGLLEAHQLTEQLIAFLADHRVIEELRVGAGRIATFVHSVFEEYAAARYMTQLDRAALQNHLPVLTSDTTWRGSLVLAGEMSDNELLIEEILNLPDSETSEYPLIAAEVAIARRTPLSADLASRLAAALLARIVAPTPLLAYEAAAVATPLAAKLPQAFRDARTLIGHQQEWTRRCATIVTVATGQPDIDPAALRDAIHSELLTWRGIVAVGLAHEQISGVLLDRGVRLLHAVQPGHDTEELYKSLLRKLPLSATRILEPVLVDIGLGVIVQENWAALIHDMRGIDWDAMRQADRDTDRAILEAILRCTGGGGNAASVSPPFTTVAALFYTMQFPETIIPEYRSMRNRSRPASVDAVMYAAINALRLDRAQLHAEALSALRILNEDAGLASMFSLLPAVSTEPDWTRATDDATDFECLVDGLAHPCSAIAVTAVAALQSSTRRANASEAARTLLQGASGQTLHFIAHIADALWPQNAELVLIERLEQGFVAGSEFLLKRIARTDRAEYHPRVDACLCAALSSDDRDLVEGSAEAVCTLRFPPSDILLQRLRDAVERWHAAPRMPDARGFLPTDPFPAVLRAAIHHGLVNRDRLFALATAHPTLTLLHEALLDRAAHDFAERDVLLADIAGGRVPADIIRTLAVRRSHLELSAEHVATLQASTIARVRVETLRHLVRPGIPLTHPLAIEALQDPDPSVRDTAVLAARRWTRQIDNADQGN